MIYYGWPKIRNLKSNAVDFTRMGFDPGIVWGTLIAAVEFFGRIAIILGFHAELAAALFAFQTLVGTFWKLEIKQPFTDYSSLFSLGFSCCVAFCCLWQQAPSRELALGSCK